MAVTMPLSSPWQRHCPAQSVGYIPSGASSVGVKLTQLQKAPHLVECLAINMLKFFIFFEQGTSPSHFSTYPHKLCNQYFT